MTTCTTKTFAMVAIAAVALAGCVRVQQPYRFTSSRAPDGLTADTARALAGLGLAPASVDERLGIITTAWQDTGFLYGEVNGASASIVRRYTVTVAPYPSGALVQVRLDAKRCQQGGYTVGEVEIRGACEGMDQIPDAHQTDLDALGLQLESALERPAPAVAPLGL